MNYQEIYHQIQKKKSFLCIGLDSDINKIPVHLHPEDDPVWAFNKAIIDQTYDLAIAYKPNLAFYESRGSEGWQSLEKTVHYIRKKDPKIFIIADAKRGDIGNTSSQYARAFFETMDFDAVTVAPYMGEDSVVPFLNISGKWVILLALTSNKGAFDFQFSLQEDSRNKLFEKVIAASATWGSVNNLMYVVGATKATMLKDIRAMIPEHFLLVPGIGAQGGSLQEVVKYGMNKHVGLIVNSSRGIIFASQGEDFSVKAREKALALQQEMKTYL